MYAIRIELDDHTLISVTPFKYPSRKIALNMAKAFRKYQFKDAAYKIYLIKTLIVRDKEVI